MWCLIDLPSTRKTTSSAMLVARSATRSRFRLTRCSSMLAPITWGSSIMCVSRIRKSERCSASTRSSRRQISRASSASLRMNASRASDSISCASRAISTISGSGVIGRLWASRSALWAMLTAWSPTRSRSLAILSAIVSIRRSRPIGCWSASRLMQASSISISRELMVAVAGDHGPRLDRVALQQRRAPRCPGPPRPRPTWCRRRVLTSFSSSWK